MDIIAHLKEIAEHLNEAERLANELKEKLGVNICQLNRNVQFIKGIELVEKAMGIEANIYECTLNDHPFVEKTLNIKNAEIIQLADFDESGNPTFRTAEPQEEPKNEDHE